MKSIKDLMNLKGSVALITGGAGHIGKAIADTLAELGANIVVLDLSEEKCLETAKEIEKAYVVKTMGIACDLSDENAIKSVPKKVKATFDRLDILVHCAAYVGTSELKGWAVPFKEQLPETWCSALDVNLTAPFILTQACAELLSESRTGSVINMASIYALVGPKMELYEGTSLGSPAAYFASKGGLLQLTRWLAGVMAPSIRVNAISPGGIERGQEKIFQDRYNSHTLLGRMGTEEDLKGAIAYLASDLSAYVTGQNIVVDGGWTVC